MIVPVFFAVAMISSISISIGGRLLMSRPVGWKRMSTCGFDIARTTRAVCSARGRVKNECTDTPTTSSFESVSSSRSSVPSFKISHSVPFNIFILPRQFFIDRVDLLPLRADALFVQAVRHRKALRVIRDHDILQPARGGGFGHRFDGIRAVGPVGLRLEIALEITVADQLRQARFLMLQTRAPPLPPRPCSREAPALGRPCGALYILLLPSGPPRASFLPRSSRLSCSL